jgi:hypothetical protein
MKVASTAMSPLGFVLDLMLHRVLTRMRKRSAAWSGGASTCWPELEGGWTRVREQDTRWLQRHEGDSSESASVARKKKEEWGPPCLGPPYL